MGKFTQSTLSAVNLFLSLHLATFQVAKEKAGIIAWFLPWLPGGGLIVAYYFSELCVEVIVVLLCSVVLLT